MNTAPVIQVSVAAAVNQPRGAAPRSPVDAGEARPTFAGTLDAAGAKSVRKPAAAKRAADGGPGNSLPAAGNQSPPQPAPVPQSAPLAVATAKSKETSGAAAEREPADKGSLAVSALDASVAAAMAAAAPIGTGGTAAWADATPSAGAAPAVNAAELAAAPVATPAATAGTAATHQATPLDQGPARQAMIQAAGLHLAAKPVSASDDAATRFSAAAGGKVDAPPPDASFVAGASVAGNAQAAGAAGGAAQAAPTAVAVNAAAPDAAAVNAAAPDAAAVNAAANAAAANAAAPVDAKQSAKPLAAGVDGADGSDPAAAAPGGEPGAVNIGTAPGGRSPSSAAAASVPPSAVTFAAIAAAEKSPHAGTEAPAASGTPPDSAAFAPPATSPLGAPADATPAPTLRVHSSIDSAEFAQGLSERISWMVDAGVNGAKLQVHPPQLGPIELRISVQGDHAQVWMTTHSAVARDALEASSPTLRQMLGDQGFSQVSVDISQRSFQDRSAYTSPYEREAAAPRSTAAPAVAAAGSAVRASSSALDAYA